MSESSNTPSRSDPIPSPLALIGWSILRGAIGGWICASIYATMVIPLVSGWIVATNVLGERFVEALIGAGIFIMCGWPCAFPLGILPGAVVGAVGGLLIGVAAALLRKILTPFMGAILGLAVAVFLMIGLHLWLGQGLLQNNQVGWLKFAPYLFWLGVPGVVMAAGLTCLGWFTFGHFHVRMPNW